MKASCSSEKCGQELRRQVETLISDISKRVQSEAVDNGEFPLIHEDFENTDTSLSLTHIALVAKSIQPDRYSPDREIMMDLVVYKLPIPYKSGVALVVGSKEKVLNYLKQPETIETIINSLPSLANNFNDIR